MTNFKDIVISDLTSSKVGAVLGGLFAFVSYVILHWRGIGLPPDGWAYWQGAVSIVEGHGYSYFSGTPISAWPPLYSLYLAFWTILLGPTGFSLVIANGALIVIQGILWSYVLVRIVNNSYFRVPSLVSVIIGIYIGLFLSLHQQQSLATSLQYTLLPIFLLEIWKLHRSGHSRSLLARVGPAAILGAALVLSHNASFAFVGAGALLVLTQSSEYKKNFLNSFLIGLIPATCWFAVRLYLNQTGSHAIGLGAGKHSYGTYLYQLISGLGGTVVPRQLGANYFASFILLLFLSYLLLRNNKLLSKFSIYSLIILYIMFNVTFVRNPIGGTRYILFVPIIALPLLFTFVYNVKKIYFKITSIVFVLPIMYWTYSWANHYIYVERDNLIESRYGVHNAVVSPKYPKGPPKHIEEGILISPKQWKEPKTGDGLLQ